MPEVKLTDEPQGDRGEGQLKAEPEIDIKTSKDQVSDVLSGKKRRRRGAEKKESLSDHLAFIARDRAPLLGQDPILNALSTLEQLGFPSEVEDILTALSEGSTFEELSDSFAELRSYVLRESPWALEKYPELCALWDSTPAHLFMGHHGEGDCIKLGTVPWACSLQLLRELIPWAKRGVRTEYHGIGGKQATAYIDVQSEKDDTCPKPSYAPLLEDWKRIAQEVKRQAKADAQKGQEGDPYYWLQDGENGIDRLYDD